MDSLQRWISVKGFKPCNQNSVSSFSTMLASFSGIMEFLTRGILKCLGNVTKQQGEESLGQTALKGSSSLWSFTVTEFVLSMARRCWVQFRGGMPSRYDLMAKICSFELYLRQLDVQEFESGTGGFDLTVQACCKEESMG